MVTGTFVSRRVLGHAARYFGNEPLAEAAQPDIEMVGMLRWSPEHQAFIRAGQEALKFKSAPLKPLSSPEPKKYCRDPSKYSSCLEQLGSQYAQPTLQ